MGMSGSVCAGMFVVTWGACSLMSVPHLVHNQHVTPVGKGGDDGGHRGDVKGIDDGLVSAHELGQR